FQLLGKSPTLTDRTLVWQDCLNIPINPVIGVGFESFWLGDRLTVLWAKWYWHPNEAHNGYLETYLNLGLLGLFILIAVLVAAFRKGRQEFLTNFHYGRFRIAFLIALIVYNWTEASFKALHPLWFVFYLIALEYPKSEPAPEPEPAAEAAGEAAPVAAVEVEVMGPDEGPKSAWENRKLSDGK
ncbi:MAG: O-antigen ligase family protein, partial [Verrucomicrobiae bacterium]|nr:O-antigen ligase family protein [Verrucomicrobiae bacterium]